MKKVYSPTKIFHHPEKVLSLSYDVKEKRAPLHVRIKPTNVCDQHCYFCAYADNELQLGDRMVVKEKIEKDKMMELIDDLESMGVKSITFSGGGEPLVYPYIEETLERIVESGKLKFAFITNGVGLKGRVLELVAGHASWVRISVDGWDAKSYSDYRKVPLDRWQRLNDNIKNLIGMRNKCLLGIYQIIDSNNANRIYDIIKYYHALGVDSIKLYGVVLYDDAQLNSQYHMQHEDTVRSQVAKAKRDFESNDFQINNGFSAKINDYSKEYSWCPSLQITPVIGADLKVYSCHDKAYTTEGEMGDLKEQSFRTFWSSSFDSFYKINPSSDCNHHCMVNVQNNLLLDYLNLYKDHIDFV